MTEQEYRQKDSKLLESIAEYNLDSAEHQMQIALNNKQVAILEIERKDLYDHYAMHKQPSQRNLQGEVIKHEN